MPKTLDRQCVGALKTCDYQEGRCESVSIDEVEASTCQIDKEIVSLEHTAS